MAKKLAKTNAARLLDKHKMAYEIIAYDKDGAVDGASVAAQIGYPPEAVYKTLVARGTSGDICVFVIPVVEELDLKRAAKAAGEKKVELVAVKEIQALTGYIRGGCSPLGMKKEFSTFLSEEAEKRDFMIVSAGKIGMQLKLVPADLIQVAGAAYAKLIAEKS
ncbi:Cys-tRNA(Pro) deacylase [Planomicrobium sp. YIM 101495]|uniref:Cys-tRNA(Pro) deacylase n=1 Tax=Planomicrobium sp. YIM 101495 TaxID=2665160 RepID=UPI0013F8F5D0|nr:Cys-tRNA(Pro) deacylase [Planomicrobium sp. YIM 101495]